MQVKEASRLSGSPTPQQKDTLRRLRVDSGSVRPAAVGLDVFAYLENGFSTRRVQIAPGGHVVGQTILTREPLFH